MAEIRLIAGYGSMVALEDYESLRAALREAEAQRDEAVGAWGRLRWEVSAERERAEAAERKVDEYRQALGGGLWQLSQFADSEGRDVAQDMRQYAYDTLKNAGLLDALRVEQPRQELGNCSACGGTGDSGAPCDACGGLGSVAEPERGGWRAGAERLAEPEREGFTPPKEGAER